MGNFSDLPSELIEIVDRNLNFVDKVRIRAVCSSLKSLLPAVPKLRSKHLPWMLLQDNRIGALIYSPHHPLAYPLDLPEIKNKIFKGSSHGWIVTLDDTNGGIDDIYIFNPLTRARLKLPPRSTFPDIKDYNPDRVGNEYILNDEDEDDETNYHCHESKDDVNQRFIEKVVLSSSPSSNDFMAVAIYGEWPKHLAWCRLDDKKWTPLTEYTCDQEDEIAVFDVIFHNGKLHALYWSGKLIVYDSIDPEVSLTEIIKEVAPHPKVFKGSQMYLVECSNFGMLLVSRNVRDDMERSAETTWFYLYKLVDSSNHDSKYWVEINDFGDNMLFIGLNSSLSVPVSDEFGSLGYKRNRIYYTDESTVFRDRCFGEDEQDSDIGTFDSGDGTTRILKGFRYKVLRGSRYWILLCFRYQILPWFRYGDEFLWPPPIWVTPSAI